VITRGTSEQEEDPEPDVQEELLPEKQSGGRGRFEKSEPTVVDGEDLDVPSFLRNKKK
jgi:cell division protein FtsZ